MAHPGIPEVNALRQIVDQLEPFDWPTQRRMLNWLRDFYEACEQKRLQAESEQTQKRG